jgi:hypothetical protein
MDYWKGKLNGVFTWKELLCDTCEKEDKETRKKGKIIVTKDKIWDEEILGKEEKEDKFTKKYEWEEIFTPVYLGSSNPITGIGMFTEPLYSSSYFLNYLD